MGRGARGEAAADASTLSPCCGCGRQQSEQAQQKRYVARASSRDSPIRRRLESEWYCVQALCRLRAPGCSSRLRRSVRRRWRTARGPTDAAIGCTQATPPSGSPALPCAPSSRVSSTGPKSDLACSQVTPARQPTPAPGHHLPLHSQSTLAQAGSRPTSPRGEPPPANRTLPRLPRLPPRRSRLTWENRCEEPGGTGGTAESAQAQPTARRPIRALAVRRA